MFPASFEGEFEVEVHEPEDVNAVLNRVEQALRTARATGISRMGTKVSFRGGIFRLVLGWNVLVPVGFGEIEVVPGKPGAVRYNFSCMEMLIMVTLMIGVLWVSMIGASIFSGAGLAVEALVFPVPVWLWLFGMNYVIGAVRLPRFVRRAVGV